MQIGLRTRLRRFLARAQRPVRLNAERAALLERVLESMREYHRIMCASAPGGRLLEFDGIVATVMPAMPERSVWNAVVYERADALASTLDELAATYEEVGVKAWMVWVPSLDGEARKLLRRAGHRLDANPTAMARELRSIERPAKGALEEWTAAGDPAVMAAICDRAFLFGTEFTCAFSGLPPGRARIYLAGLDGEPVSCVMTSDKDENCAVDLVATVPEAQGYGLSDALLAHALADAAERGCATSTLVATPAGRPVYRKLGYRALCPLQQWERRRSAAP